MEGEMVNQRTAEGKLIDRRGMLRVAAGLAAAGPALLHGTNAQAQPRPSGASPMTIIDAQVHAYAANTPERPWHTVPNWPPHVTGDEMVAAMNKVGVDGAIYISPVSMYQYDASYAVGVQKAHPDKFALIKPVNPDDPAVADVISDWKKTPGTVGIRIIMTKESKRAPDDPGFDRILRAAIANDFPVNVLFWGNIDAGTALIDRHPDARFIIDHLGIQQPSMPPAPPQPWADLPKVLELAKRKNAVIKITGACTLSRAPYPFPDIWDPSLACSTPGVSTAAYGALTGHARSLSSTTSRPSSPS
jgi:L-fuconolactonase